VAQTISELHTQFKILYDNISSFANPEYTPEEIDFFLNTAQDELMKLVEKGGAERDQIIRDYLSNITTNYTTNTFITTSDNTTNGVFATLPTNYRYSLKETADVAYTDCNDNDSTREIPVIPTTHDKLNYISRNPFKRPSSSERVVQVPFGTLAGYPGQQVVELITDGTFTVSNYKLRYLRDPLQMAYASQYATPGADVDPELNIDANNWIVDYAVALAKEASGQVSKQSNK
jgi:hypothetical protein